MKYTPASTPFSFCIVYYRAILDTWAMGIVLKKLHICSVDLLKITYQARQPAHRGYQGFHKRVRRRGVLFDDLVMTLDTYLKEIYSGSARCSVHLPVARSFMGCWNEAVCCASPYPAN